MLYAWAGMSEISIAQECHENECIDRGAAFHHIGVPERT